MFSISMVNISVRLFRWNVRFRFRVGSYCREESIVLLVIICCVGVIIKVSVRVGNVVVFSVSSVCEVFKCLVSGGSVVFRKGSNIRMERFIGNLLLVVVMLCWVY